jgi:DNA-binding beta-propeller fold protein YncE
VAVVDRDGKAVSKIAAKGSGYELDDPVSLAIDLLGHVYVLDPGRSSIFVFGAKNRLVSTLTIPDRSPGALNRAEAIGVDAAGRLFVFDGRTRRVQVFQ